MEECMWNKNAYCAHILYSIEYTHNVLLSYCQFIVDSRNRITHIHHTRTLGLYSLSGRTSYRKISWSIKAASVWIRLLFGGKTSCRLLSHSNVAFWPLCDFSALSMWLFGTCQCDFLALMLFPASCTLPRELKKIYRNSLEIKKDNEIQFQWHK